MEKILYDKSGQLIAYIADDYNSTIFLWDGNPVAYLYEEKYVYGMNGRHLGWFIDEIIYGQQGKRIGFTSMSCPVPIGKETPKPKRQALDMVQPKWQATSMPKLTFEFDERALSDFLLEGQVARFKKAATEDSEEEEEA